jgi:hypothetical protein
LGIGYSKTNNGLRYLIAHAINSPIDSPHAPHGQASVNQGVAIFAGIRPFLALRFDAPLALSNPLACWGSS